MPLDHYVSQVHLKNFYSPLLENRMYATRKSDLETFTPRAQDVCRRPDWSTNKYLTDERAIEKFLLDVEPAYNAAVENLRQGKIGSRSVYVIAGFVAYVTGCSAAAMRINIGPMENVLEGTARLLDKTGALKEAPEVLSGKSLTQLLDEKLVRFEVDGKYPQAIGINSILQRVSTFGNGRWEILINSSDSPYVTSDFPAAIESQDGSLVINRVIPLAPDIAVRITPDPSMRGKMDLSFPKFEGFRRNLRRSEVVSINRLVVQCAEELIFYRDDLVWVPNFIARYAPYRIEAAIEQIPYGDTFLMIARQRLVRQSST
jgi:hypothetical protein